MVRLQFYTTCTQSKAIRARSRFVPWNEEQFRLLSNGPTSEGYLDYLEENVFDPDYSLLPQFISKLEFSGASPLIATLEENVTATVRPSTSLFACLNDEPYPTTSIKKKHMCEVLDKPNADTLRPCSRNLGLLIEYMSYKTGVEPSAIEKFALDLDDELMTRFVNFHRPRKEMKPSDVYSWLIDPTTFQIGLRPKGREMLDTSSEPVDLSHMEGTIAEEPARQDTDVAMTETKRRGKRKSDSISLQGDLIQKPWSQPQGIAEIQTATPAEPSQVFTPPQRRPGMNTAPF